ncbi:phage tail tape measure protein, TP901 family, core region [Micromonospora sediminicola]|uniref:Phage tail tape measure protein, TP901 family, core region n=1 Tax=Micromonospora sediminicola TaxID=946078 RepID=A0A1A9B3Z7_9ACTN|nr:phage tail tape measure protein [Micromonospora sediminicola]SBT64215.1 phage tail tape measure protein, TP901 family, core region [Micromonospora sediminicola]
MAGLRTVGVRLAADVSGFRAGMRQAGAATSELRGELDKAARAGKLDALADQAGRMGLVLAAGFGAAVAMAAKFDKQMSEVAAVSDATGKELDQLRQAALKAGADTAFSATEAAKAEAELAKAGLKTSDILGGALNGSLALAAAGSLDLAESADIAAKTMNVFKLKGADVGHIADVLAAAANKSATDVHEMGEALKQGGLAANAAGMGLEETVGTLAAFADRALVGSDAGTSLKTALMMLQAPTDKSAALMDKLGIAAYDANGEFIGTTRLAGVLQKALGGLTQEQRNAALATIFGADGMRAANIMYELGEKGIQDYTKAVDDQGAAADVAAKKMDNLAGDVEKLKGSLETMAIEAGSGANSGLRILVQAAGALVDELDRLPPALTSTLTVMAGVAGGALLLGAGWVRVRRSTRDMLDELREVGPAGQRAARGLETASKWAGRAAVTFAAFEVAGAAITAMQKDLNPQIDAMAKGLGEWGKTGALAGESARVLGGDMQDLAVGLKFLADTDNKRRQSARFMQDILENTWIIGPALRGTNTSLDRTRERVEAMDSALAQLASGGKADEAAAAFNRLADAAAKDGVSIEELKALFPQYAAALEVAGKASTDAAGGVKQVGGAAGQAADEVQELKEAFDALFKQEMSYDKALLAYKQGIADVKAELRDGTRTLNDNTQAGRDNIAAVLEQVDRIKALRDARLEHGETLDEVNGKYVKDIDGLRRTMLQAGYTKGEVDALIGKYKAVPGEVSTDVSAPGTTKATGQVQDFNFAVRNVPPSKTVPFWASTGEAKAAVEALKSKIAELKDKHIYISGTVRWTSTGDLKVPGGTILKNDRGGVYEHAAVGLLRQAQIAAPQGPARYAWAEPSTGGELFAPRFGDMARTRALVGYAIENWWGGWRNFAPSSGYGGQASGQITYDNRITVQPRQANFTVHDLTALQQRQDALARVGRPR